MGCLRAVGIRRRVHELREYARVLSFLTGELRYRRDILSQVFARVGKKCKDPFASWLLAFADTLTDMQDISGLPEPVHTSDFYQIWIKNADGLYEQSGLKKEDMEYIYNLGQTVGYLDVQAQEDGLALLQADLLRHIRELEKTSKEQIRLSLVLGTIAGVLLVVILI